MNKWIGSALAGLVLLAGCSNPQGESLIGAADRSASSDAGAKAAATIGTTAASRFLAQATFGGSPSDVSALASQTNYNNWFAQQAAATPCLESPRITAQAANGVAATAAARVEAWWYCAIQGPDQLRQRMAFALSQILVVSDQSELYGYPMGMAYYYDILTSNALGNYRTLLGAIARSPEMGFYLNMLGSQKAVPSLGIRADENFSRELMQLFSVGLYQLNADGSQKLVSGSPVATYSQTDVEQQANALTGWGWPGGQFIYGTPNLTAPMQVTAAFHDTSAKTIINQTSIPAGMNGDAELDKVLDTVFNHPNVGPFISRQLIQRLVASNPSAAYVARVAAVFNNNGSGVRGDLLAVAKAILTDTEARSGTGLGKVREPLLRFAQLWRVFTASAGNGRYDFANPELPFGEAPLRAPSVFNFYRPDYTPPGTMTASGLAAPELQILNESTVNTGGNAFWYAIFRYRGTTSSSVTDNTSVALDFRSWTSAAATPATLVDKLDLYLTGASTPTAIKQKLVTYLTQIPAKYPELRIAEVVDLLMHLPQSYVQH